MHNRDGVYHCVGHCVCQGRCGSPQFDSESRKKGKICRRVGGRKEETEFLAVREKGKVMRVLELLATVKRKPVTMGGAGQKALRGVSTCRGKAGNAGVWGHKEVIGTPGQQL